MVCRRTQSIHLSFFLFLVFFASSEVHHGISSDTILPGQSLSGNQTLVSKEGKFELGFFKPGESFKYYVGIWYKSIRKQTVVWVANRERPISNSFSSQLKLSDEGNVVLLDHTNLIIWSSNSTRNSLISLVAVLLDTGNLVLRSSSNSSAIIWQSFDHPTDTFLPESWVGMNKITGEYQSLTSWKSSEDPAPGYFVDTIDPGGRNEFLMIWNGSVIYQRSGIWNGHSFSAVTALPSQPWTIVANTSFVNDEQRRYTTYSLHNNSVLARISIGVNGQVTMWVWQEIEQDWLPIYSRPTSGCDVYSVCGAFGVCDQKGSLLCRCLHGYKPVNMRDWESGDWNAGCVRKTSLQCSSNNSSEKDKDGFQLMPNMKLPSNSQLTKSPNFEECRSVSSSNCTCTAYAYDESECLIWKEELRNLQQQYEGDAGARTLYLRLAASDLPSFSRKKNKIEIILIGVFAGFVAIFCFLLSLRRKIQRKIVIKRRGKAEQGSLVSFSYAELKHMTKNFSEKLGSGGFGSVYKGILPDSTAVAVKKLEGIRQGEKQFRAELSTLGAIQHVNLVRLRGFCAGEQKMLVYDFMKNGSLASYCSENNGKLLDWRARYQIILGIARGLAYLHEECRDQIIHCDVKPENVLLDDKDCPKLADFGMAKLIGRECSRVLTTMRGTVGYLAPEWISGLPIASKADVFSFGMMIFEVIAGRRNINGCMEEGISFTPFLAVDGIVEGNFISLLDKRLENNVDMEELKRVCQVAYWCIQDLEDYRPSMGQVVQILETAVQISVPPVPRFLLYSLEDDDSGLLVL